MVARVGVCCPVMIELVALRPSPPHSHHSTTLQRFNRSTTPISGHQHPASEAQRHCRGLCASIKVKASKSQNCASEVPRSSLSSRLFTIESTIDILDNNNICSRHYPTPNSSLRTSMKRIHFRHLLCVHLAFSDAVSAQAKRSSPRIKVFEQ